MSSQTANNNIRSIVNKTSMQCFNWCHRLARNALFCVTLDVCWPQFSKIIFWMASNTASIYSHFGALIIPNIYACIHIPTNQINSTNFVTVGFLYSPLSGFCVTQLSFGGVFTSVMPYNDCANGRCGTNETTLLHSMRTHKSNVGVCGKQKYIKIVYQTTNELKVEQR